MNLKHLTALVMLSLGVTSASGIDTYQPPVLEKRAFVSKELKLNKIARASLMQGLVITARDFDKKSGVDFKLRAHALSMAYHLKPGSETVDDLLTQLKNRGRTISEGKNSKEKAVTKISRGIKALMKGEPSAANLACARYCADIALRLKVGGKDVSRLRAMQAELGRPDWRGFTQRSYSTLAYRKPWERVRHGKEQGSIEIAKKGNKRLGATKRVAVGVSRKKTNCRRFLSSSYKIVAKGKESKSVEGLKLMTEGEESSPVVAVLQTAAQLLEQRHCKSRAIPGGYTIKVSIDGDHDNDESMGLPMAVSLDSMITGMKIDPAVAMTGEITPFGQLDAIDDPVRGVMTAHLDGRKIIVFPAANTQTLADFYLIHGLSALLETQCFGVETFEQALKVVDAQKSKALQGSMADYRELAAEVKEKGQDVLKSDGVQARLMKITEAVPEHRSAKFLLKLGQGEAPRQISIEGSYALLDFLTTGLLVRYNDLSSDPSFIPEKNEAEEAKLAYAELNALNVDHLNDNFREYYASIVKAGEVFIQVVDDGVMSKGAPPRGREAREKEGKLSKKMAAIREKRKEAAGRLRVEVVQVFEEHGKLFKKDEISVALLH